MVYKSFQRPSNAGLLGLWLYTWLYMWSVLATFNKTRSVDRDVEKPDHVCNIYYILGLPACMFSYKGFLGVWLWTCAYMRLKELVVKEKNQVRDLSLRLKWTTCIPLKKHIPSPLFLELTFWKPYICICQTLWLVLRCSDLLGLENQVKPETWDI